MKSNELPFWVICGSPSEISTRLLLHREQTSLRHLRTSRKCQNPRYDRVLSNIIEVSAFGRRAVKIR